MQRLLTVILSTLCLLTPLCGKERQKLQVVEATYEYRSDNPNESRAQAEQTAIERARQQALADAFGTDVSSTQSLLTISTTQGEQASSVNHFAAASTTSVRGVWLKTLKEEVIDGPKYINGFWYVKVYVRGQARQRRSAEIDIRATLVNHPTDRDQRQVFYDGDDLYLRFSSPVNGALCVYLIDEQQNAFCLLPYESSTMGYQPIQANRDYTFFYAATDPHADEYTLNTERQQEQNTIYIVFTPNTLSKANDRRGGKNWLNQPLPRVLSYADFITWLEDNRIKDEEMIDQAHIISIRRK